MFQRAIWYFSPFLLVPLLFLSPCLFIVCIIDVSTSEADLMNSSQLESSGGKSLVYSSTICAFIFQTKDHENSHLLSSTMMVGRHLLFIQLCVHLEMLKTRLLGHLHITCMAPLQYLQGRKFLSAKGTFSTRLECPNSERRFRIR